MAGGGGQWSVGEASVARVGCAWASVDHQRHASVEGRGTGVEEPGWQRQGGLVPPVMTVDLNVCERVSSWGSAGPSARLWLSSLTSIGQSSRRKLP
jgi:hypothetical protein